jgi:signal transduction histidine kinase
VHVVERIATALRFSVRALVVHLAAVAAGVVFTVVGALAILDDKPVAIEPASMTTTVGLLAPMLLLLLLRRRLPLASLLASTALLMAVRELDVPELQVSSVAWTVSLYSAGRYGDGQARHAVRAVSILAALGLLVRDVVTSWDDLELFGLTERTFVLTATANTAWNLVLFVGTWYAGDIARNRFLRERELAARTLELELSREENARRAVMDERVRIARELHDVVAHHVSVMGVQAGAARLAVRSDPERAEAPLRSIEESSREAVHELHRLLGFLRRVDEVDPDGLSPDALAPRPGLDRLPELRRQLAAAGLALRLTETGVGRPLPASVDLSAFRILQEALTNCLKYAGVDQADVELDYGPDRLTVAVRDRGRGPARPDAGPCAGAPNGASAGGAGLLGMAERAALLGGTLRHGPRDGGGFEVVAELPYDGVVSAAPAARPPASPVSARAVTP